MPVQTAKPTDTSFTLANAYRSMHQDIFEGSTQVPQFEDAATSGQRKSFY